VSDTEPSSKVASATAPTTTSATASLLTQSEAPVPVPVGPAGGHGADHDSLAAAGVEHGAHPTDAQYIKIAALLACITAVEVAVYYVKGGLGDGFAPLLLCLAAIKFFIVGSYFMHLRFDNRVLRRLFITGIVLACVIYAFVFLILGVFSGTHGAHK
jgi:cytochrome c oxidase subunit IV